ncbi:hypothetical protein ACWGF2_37870 [Streptomyces sp. NPDC054919]
MTLSIGARIIMRGCWSDEAAAEGKYTRWIAERAGVDGAWITLTDEADGGRAAVLAAREPLMLPGPVVLPAR